MSRDDDAALWSRPGRRATAGLSRIDTLDGYGRPEEIACAVEYFVTAGGRHVSGQIWRVGGGDQTWPA